MTFEDLIMAVKIVTSFSTLMNYAREVGKARKSGDEEALAIAEANLEAYEDLIRKSHKMIIPQYEYR
jgi:hypothetical protein